MAPSKIVERNAGFADMTDPPERSVRIGRSGNDFFDEREPPRSIVGRLRPGGKGDFLSLLGRSSIVIPGACHRGIDIEAFWLSRPALGVGRGSPPAT